MRIGEGGKERNAYCQNDVPVVDVVGMDVTKFEVVF